MTCKCKILTEEADLGLMLRSALQDICGVGGPSPVVA